MTTTPTLNPQILGQAESAHRAILDRILAGPGNTYHQWVALNFTAVSGAAIDRDQLVDQMTGALKIDDPAAREAIAELTAARLLQTQPGDRSPVHLTDAGQELHRQIRTAINETITWLYSDLPADDLATAGRVLTVITARANTELAGA
jgi:DNA-binding MarR family transcriptional regulator